MAGGMGALMLDGYGWESMFYTTAVLSSLWALVVWQCFLKGRRTFAMDELVSAARLCQSLVVLTAITISQ